MNEWPHILTKDFGSTVPFDPQTAVHQVACFGYILKNRLSKANEWSFLLWAFSQTPPKIVKCKLLTWNHKKLQEQQSSLIVEFISCPHIYSGSPFWSFTSHEGGERSISCVWRLEPLCWIPWSSKFEFWLVVVFCWFVLLSVSMICWMILVGSHCALCF